MSGQVQDCVYFQLQGKCARGSRCFFYHRQLEPDICRNFLFNRCKYGTNSRQCGKRHVTARDLPAVTSREKERVKLAKVYHKEALEEINKPVVSDEEQTEQGRNGIKESKLMCLDCEVELPTPWDLYNHQLTIQHCDVIKKIYGEGKAILGVEGDEAEWCTGCNVRFKSSHEKALHFKGKFHTIMAESLELIEKAANSSEKKIACKQCKIANIPHTQMRSHLYSQKHVEVLQSLLSDKDDSPNASGDNFPPGVYVGNLLPTVEDWELKIKFKKFGKVLDVKMPKSNAERDFTWAIVRFEKSIDAEKAIEALHDTRMDGRKLRVQWKSVNDKLFCKICKMYCSSQDGLSEHYTEKHPQVKESELGEGKITVFVGNLPVTTNSLEIQAMFGKFGSLLKNNVPKIKVKGKQAWTVVNFTKMSNAEKAVEALNNKEVDGRKLVVYLTSNIKYYCELCQIYCTCQVNLEKHYLGKQHMAKKQAITYNPKLGISDRTNKATIQTIPQLSEFPPIKDTPRKSTSMGESASKLESMTKTLLKPNGNDSGSLALLKDWQEPQVSTVPLNPKSTTSKQMYSTICKSPVKPKTSGNPKPLEGLGEGRRNKNGLIECSMCGALFKYTQDFAKHYTSSEEHKAATARLEKRMMAEEELKRNNDIDKVPVNKQAINNSHGPKMADQTMIQGARNQKAEQNELLLQQMATQTLTQQQMYPLRNLAVPVYSNPLLLHNGSAGDQVLTNTQIEREMYMKVMAERQAQMQLEQIYYENQRLAAQMDLNANIERIKQLDEMEKQKKKNIFLQQVEIGRLEELKRLKIKENDSKDSKNSVKPTENNNEDHHINTDIFQSEDEEEEMWQDGVTQ